MTEAREALERWENDNGAEYRRAWNDGRKGMWMVGPLPDRGLR